MGTIASQITSLTSVYSNVYSGADQSKHQSSASLAFVWGIHRGPVNSPYKWPVTRKMFPLDDVIMIFWKLFIIYLPNVFVLIGLCKMQWQYGLAFQVNSDNAIEEYLNEYQRYYGASCNALSWCNCRAISVRYYDSPMTNIDIFLIQKRLILCNFTI